MIEHHFDISFVASMALREKQIQQNYRPIIAVHKWFARRPGTLFRALLLSEFGERKLRDIYFKANNLAGIHVADPFMGGGTPLLEANRSIQRAVYSASRDTYRLSTSCGSKRNRAKNAKKALIFSLHDAGGSEERGKRFNNERTNCC